ncbi:MAG TPA: TIGR03617 family F420-dependent LLM class oxidoreductase [Acidimicrobiales bacterium]
MTTTPPSGAPTSGQALRFDAPLDAPYPDVERQARELAAAGFDGAFTLESNRDVLFPLVLAARSGAGLELYSNVAVALPRSPMHLAYQAWDLHQLSGGRFALGVGSQIRPHIEKRYSARWDRPVRQLRELVSATKAIFDTFAAGARLDFRGDYYTFTLMTPTFVPPPLEWGPPPIWMGALGPLMTRAAAEVADGVLIHPFNTARYLRERTVPGVEAGLAASGRARSDLTVTVTVIVCVYETEEERAAAEKGCRFNLAFYGSTPSYRVTLDVHGWGDVQPELNRLSKEGRWGEMGSLVDDEMLRTICVCGTPAEVARQLRERYAGVADRVAFSLPYGVRRDLLAEVLDRARRE